MRTRMLAVVALAGALACSRGDRGQPAVAADSLDRDLQLAPVDTSRPLSDRPAVAAAEPERAPAPAPRPAARPRPRPAPSRPAPASAPAAAPVERVEAPAATLAAG